MIWKLKRSSPPHHHGKRAVRSFGKFSIGQGNRSTASSSCFSSADANAGSSPGRFYSNDMPEPRIPLTRVDIDEKHTRNLSSYYPTLPQTKPTYSPSSQETITHSFSPQRSSVKADTRPSTTSYGLRNPYDFQSDEPVATRQEHKATPFRATNISSADSSLTNTSRYARGSEVPSTMRSTLNAGSDLNEIRSRISTSTNEQKDTKLSKDTWAPKTSSQNDLEKKTSSDKDQLAVAAKSKSLFKGDVHSYSCILFALGGGTLLYTGIAVSVALFVFILYLWLEK